jgi:hypothetical protein
MQQLPGLQLQRNSSREHHSDCLKTQGKLQMSRVELIICEHNDAAVFERLQRIAQSSKSPHIRRQLQTAHATMRL